MNETFINTRKSSPQDIKQKNKDNSNFSFFFRFAIFIVATGLVIVLGSIIKSNNDYLQSKPIVFIAIISFIALTVKIFGEGKGNKLLAFVFWTVCLLMIVDVRVQTVSSQSNISGNLRKGSLESFVSVVKEERVSEESNDFQSKISAALQCFNQCEDNDSTQKYIDNKRVLEGHYFDVLEGTKGFRPQKRNKVTVYKNYLGPRLEDHFIHNMISEDFKTFNPLVPLYIHWTEVYFSRAGGGMTKLMAYLKKTLRKDVIYITVASCETKKIQKTLQNLGLTVIFASSKGDPAAQIILPHLFRYNSPGFDSDGKPVFSDEHYKGVEIDFDYSFQSDESVQDRFKDLDLFQRRRGYHEKVVRLREMNNIRKTTPEWRFNNYTSYFSLDEGLALVAENVQVNDTFPESTRVSFVGNLGTHRGRSKLVKGLKKTEGFVYKQYKHNEQCVDYSAGTDFSACWRTLMLSSGLTLAPVGTAPVSYRMYESLQMGLPLMYIYDERGSFIPYKGTKADVSNFGIVTPFDQASDEINKLLEMSEQDFSDLMLNMKQKISKVRDTHFTPQGTIGQLKRWITNPHTTESDLRCCDSPTLL